MASRESWITAARNALAERGLDAVRVEALARGMGLTKGSFYWHFADRGALLEALLSDLEERERLRLATLPIGGPRERLSAFVGVLAAEPLDALVLEGLRAGAAQLEPGLARRLRLVESARIELVRQELAAAIGAGAGAAAHLFYLAMAGWIERAARSGQVPDPRRFVSFALDRLGA